MINKTKEWLDETILPDTSVSQKLKKAIISPDEENEAGLIATFIVFLDNLRQSAPSEKRYQNLISKIADSVESGKFMNMLSQIVGRG